MIAKARGYERGFPWWVGDMFTQYQEHGVDYITALLTGYEDAAGRLHAAARHFLQQVFPRPRASRCRRRSPTSASNTPTARRRRSSNIAKDVSAFLMWAAEPHLEARKRIGMQVMIFLIVLRGPALFHQEEGVARRGACIPKKLEAARPPDANIPARSVRPSSRLNAPGAITDPSRALISRRGSCR